MKIKKSPILFLSIIFIPLLIYLSINYLYVDTEGGVTLVGAFAVFLLVITLIILFIEQLILRKINNLKKVWIVEITLILLMVLISIYFSD